MAYIFAGLKLNLNKMNILVTICSVYIKKKLDA